MTKESDPVRAAELFEQSVAIMARLRAPDGCPWDREQTFDTIRKYTLEEAYEVFDAIERRDFPHLAEELGDLLLQVLFYAEMAANEGRFTIADVLNALNQKLVRRHPHVFGEEASRAAGNQANVDANVEGSAVAVLRNWEEIKALEKKPQAEHQSRLDGISRALPALAEAGKIGAKAAKAGFDWLGWRDLLPKIQEEVAELEAEAERGEKAAMEAELGDLLFTVVNLARHLGVDAEMALRGCNARFRGRFNEMEKAAAKPLEELTPSELEDLWAAAKKQLQGAEKQGPGTRDEGKQGPGTRDQGPEERGPRDQGTEGPRGRKATADPSTAAAAAASAQDDKLLSRAQDDEEMRVLRSAQDDKEMRVLRSAQDDTLISDKGDEARGKA